ATALCFHRKLRSLLFFLFLLMRRRPPRPPLFPYTTLFRSHSRDRARHDRRRTRPAALRHGRLERRDEPRGTRRPRRKHVARLLRSEEHTSELQSPCNLVCRLLLEKKKQKETRLVQVFYCIH